MLRFFQKYAAFAALAFVALLLLYQVGNYDLAAVKSIGFSTSYRRPQGLDNGQFKWRSYQPHHPLKFLVPLPAARPKRLPRVQHEFGPETNAAREIRLGRRAQIKQAFQRCWASYKDRAWLRDEVTPVSGHGINTFGGWAASLVDALDTLWIMDMKAEFQEAAAACQNINFTSSTDEEVNMFETNIRYLGGFLGAYDLSGDATLLDRALEVGDMLMVAFDTPNHLPITRWHWRKALQGERQEAPNFMLVSELGSFTLEFTRLSQLTGDYRFYDAVHRITNLFDTQQAKTRIPGMWPVTIDPKHSDLTTGSGFTLGGMSDSTYEYFPKQYALLGGAEPVYRKLYEHAMTAASKHLFFRPMTPNNDDILISGDASPASDGRSFVTEPKGQHLGCFTGGMLGLGGRLFNIYEDVEIGRRLTEGCVWAYKSMGKGVMPEISHFIACDNKKECAWDEKRWFAEVLQRHQTNDTATEIIEKLNLPKGFTSFDDRRYILRPEAIESVFIMWRITGDEAYRDAAWNMWTAISEVSTTELANAAITDITGSKSSVAPQDDRMESFFLAETLKYFYLIFSEPELISLDEFVLNTEAHPLRRPKNGRT